MPNCSNCSNSDAEYHLCSNCYNNIFKSYIVMVIAEENVILLKEQAQILLPYLGGGIAKHVGEKEKILTYHLIAREL